MILPWFPKTLLTIVVIFIFTTCSKNNDPGGPNVTPPDPKKCASCTYVVPANQGTIDGLALGFKPGDTICLDAALKYSTLIFKNIIGTNSKPIIITNCDGTVNITVSGKAWNLKTANSKYFRLTGGDTDGYYGIKLSGSTADGIVLTDLSTNFEVDHMEVSNVGFAGIMAKTDPSCDDATNRGNFTMRDVALHDNYVHDTGGEGFYIGHSFYGGIDVAGCGTKLPHTIEGINIYNNHVVKSGWDGIQLSCAVKDAAVYANVIENYAVKDKADQQNGIILGSGTGGLCYGNLITGGTGPGISVFGLGDNLIHDNIVVNAGDKGMFCDERSSTGNGFQFVNNTIVNPKAEGIAIYAETLPMNICINNIIVNPGTFAKYGESSYVLILKDAKVNKINNYITRDINDIKFINPGKNDFHLQSSSPAVDQGTNISDYHIDSDFYKGARLKGSDYDIGASEF